MTEGHRLVARDVGNLLLIAAVVAALVIPAALLHREYEGAAAMLVTAGIATILGFPLSRIKVTKEPRQRHALVIAALGWLLIPAVSAVPFVYLGVLPFVDSVFEAMSGWTGTGFTLTDPSTLPATLQWWRTSIQWFGGVGVIVLTLLVLSRPGAGSYTLYLSEGREEKLRPNILSTVRTIWGLYLSLTVLGILFLYAIGMTPYEAVHHGMTSIATGGFSTRTGNIEAFDDVGVELAILPLIIMGAIPFLAHFNLARGRVRAFFKDLQVRALLVGLALGLVALFFAILDTYPTRAEAARVALFQWVSALTTAGFQSADITVWPESAKIILALAMVSGGAAGSTAGGIKLFRTAMLVLGVRWKMMRANLPPDAITVFKYGPARLTTNEANREFAEAAFVSFLWVITMILVLFAILHHLPAENTLGDAIVEAASILGNNGISAGTVVPESPDTLKAILVFGMWAGRLELFPVLILLRNALLRRGAFSWAH